jgi:N-acetylglutamate synthase-like GNAT family acetyltransferase
LREYSPDEIAQIIKNTKRLPRPIGDKRATRARKYILEGLQEIAQRRTTSSIILNDDGQAIALAVMYPETGYISRVASLSPGLGTVVMTDLIDKAKEAKINRLFLQPNPASLAFYAKFGFVPRRGFMFLFLP